MPEETTPVPEGIEVSKPVIEKGTVVPSFKYPAPDRMKRVIKGLNYFIAGLVTSVAATDLFTGGQAKVICFILGVIILALGALELSTGVKPAEEK